MKPRLRKVYGMWMCGLSIQSRIYWSVAPTPIEAYELWARVQ